jgi:hypothetical protein
MKKNKKFEPDVNEILINKFIDKFCPNLFKTMAKWSNQFENLDYSQPKTLMKKFEKDIEKNVQPISSLKFNLFLRFVRLFLLKSPFVKNEFVSIPNKMAKLVKNLAKEDSRYSLLLELISEVDKKYPLSPLIIAVRHGDIRETFPINCSPMPYLLEAEKNEGEKRAFYVYEAMRHICEHIYQPYIRTIWQLSYLRIGELPPTNEPKYGNMLDVCIQNLPRKFHILIEPAATIMRNAPSHNTLNWVNETDSIILKDKEKQLEISVTDLLQKLASMLQISSLTISRVGQLYMFRTFGKDGIMEKLFDLLPEFISNDEKRVSLAEIELHAFIKNLLKMRGISVIESN